MKDVFGRRARRRDGGPAPVASMAYRARLAAMTGGSTRIVAERLARARSHAHSRPGVDIWRDLTGGTDEVVDLTAGRSGTVDLTADADGPADRSRGETAGVGGAS